MQKKICIAVDAMGGDFAPAEIVKGVASASVLEPEVDLILVGKEDMLRSELSSLGNNVSNIEIEHAPEVVDMHDRASWSIKSKGKSSIAVGAKLVKEDKADAFISAGNTGAVTSACLLIMGRLPGVLRPAIGVRLPSATRPVLLVDAGATVDCKPQHLVQFAQMAYIYMERVLDAKSPSIGLLSVGEEKGKGNYLVQKSYELLEKTDLNFVGNIEGTDVAAGKSDIVVCDGFTGNVVLKLMEGVASFLFSEIKDVAESSLMSKFGGALLAPKLKELKKRLDYEEYGGAQLFGVDGVCIICHGASKAKAIRNAVTVAIKTVREDVNGEIKKVITAEDDN